MYEHEHKGQQAMRHRLHEEIAYLEKRLHTIGHTGDCAYEKALERSYRNLLEQRRALLADISLQPTPIVPQLKSR